MLSAKIRTKQIIGRTKWILEYFSYLALVEYHTKWIRIKWGPGVGSKNISFESKIDYLHLFIDQIFVEISKYFETTNLISNHFCLYLYYFIRSDL